MDPVPILTILNRMPVDLFRLPAAIFDLRSEESPLLLEHFRQKCETVSRPEMRLKKRRAFGA